MSIRILNGDCRDVLKTLPDESVHCCVTSPPYFGLRSYDESALRTDLDRRLALEIADSHRNSMSCCDVRGCA